MFFTTQLNTKPSSGSNFIKIILVERERSYHANISQIKKVIVGVFIKIQIASRVCFPLTLDNLGTSHWKTLQMHSESCWWFAGIQSSQMQSKHLFFYFQLFGVAFHPFRRSCSLFYQTHCQFYWVEVERRVSSMQRLEERNFEDSMEFY